MSLPRSTFYDAPAMPLDDTEIVGRIDTICDEFRLTVTGASAPT
jgi:hypothetical protein